MKKKKNLFPEEGDEEEIFPVDNLGIPILVEVVSPGADRESSEQTAELLTEKVNTEPNPLHSEPEAGQDMLGDSPANPELERLTRDIVRSVNAEIGALLEPLIRSKVDIALQRYREELLEPADQEPAKKERPDHK